MPNHPSWCNVEVLERYASGANFMRICTARRTVIWDYSFNARARELTLRNGEMTRRCKLNGTQTWYELMNLDTKEADYVNEDCDCCA